MGEVRKSDQARYASPVTFHSLAEDPSSSADQKENDERLPCQSADDVAPEMEWKIETESVWRNMKYRFRSCPPCVAERERFDEHVRGDQYVRDDDPFATLEGVSAEVEDRNQNEGRHAGVAGQVVIESRHAQAESDPTDRQYAGDEYRKGATVFQRPQIG